MSRDVLNSFQGVSSMLFSKYSNANQLFRMDLIDSEDSPNIVGIFELPGIKTEHISLTITDGELTIMGERRSPYPKKFVPLPRNPITTADSVALGEMDTDTDINAPPSIEKRELRFGTFSRTLPVPRGLKVTHFLSSSLALLLILTHVYP